MNTIYPDRVFVNTIYKKFKITFISPFTKLLFGYKQTVNMDYESLISITIRKKRASAEKPVISLYFDDIIFCKSSGNYALCTFMYFFSYEIKTNHLHNNGQYPGCRIRNKQHRQRPVIRENSENPYDPGSNRTDHRQDHWNSGMSHSTQCSRKQIHDPA